MKKILITLILPSLLFASSVGANYVNTKNTWIPAAATSSTPAAPACGGVAGCTLWYDLQDATKYTLVGSNVSVLTDKSSAGNNATQGTDAVRMAYNATAINGHPGMTSISTSVMNVASKVFTTPSTYFFVGSNTGSAGIYFGESNNAGNAAGGYLWISAGFPFVIFDGTNDKYSQQAGMVTNNVAFVSCMTTDGTTAGSKGYVNNTQATTNIANDGTDIIFPTAPANIYLGNTLAGTNAFVGSYGEIIKFDTVLSSGDRTTVHDYLKARWGTP